MKITYWGVRGTIATPGPQTVRYGGNTSCVAVEVGDTVLVLDTGSGVRLLGAELMGRGKRIVIMQSHQHYDHIGGLPYFAPLYDSNQDVFVVGVDRIDGGVWYATDIMDGVHFPKRFVELPCRIKRVRFPDIDWMQLTGCDFKVELIPVHHPGGAHGFRLSHAGRTFVHIPDNELGANSEVDSVVLSRSEGAAVLSHDAQWLNDDLPEKEGWGHSVIDAVCELARRARVGKLVLFHHDPSRSDDELERLNVAMSSRYDTFEVLMAREGLRLDV